MVGTGAGPTESPFVVARDEASPPVHRPRLRRADALLQEDGRYGPEARAAYRRTRVLASPDPLRFRAEDQVATIDVHAAEVVHDEQDRWWVSHCGWGEGGVYLAPLTWR